MADKKNETAAPEAEEAQRQIAVNAQYVKDLSFENPNAPKSLIGNESRPIIDINVDVRAGSVGEDIYEVSLTLNCKASREDDVSFICELNYAGVFTIKGVADAEKEPALLIFCPSLLFPFARRIIADTTRDGGFPPLMLDPIDFAALYAQRKQAAQEAEAAPAN